MHSSQPNEYARRRRPLATWTLAAAALGLSVTVLTTMDVKAEPARQKPDEDAFFKVCSDCHEPDRIRETKRTRGGWEDVIFQMIDKGAIGTETDFTLVLQYLLGNYGMVNVNQAPAPEIALVTGLSQAEAETVVAFRKDKGNFKNFEALVTVPGIDVKKLEEHKGSILF